MNTNINANYARVENYKADAYYGIDGHGMRGLAHVMCRLYDESKPLALDAKRDLAQAMDGMLSRVEDATALLEAKPRLTQGQLAEAQMQHWPDSKLLTIGEALGWIAEAQMPNADDEKEIERYTLIHALSERRHARMTAITRNERVRVERSKSVAQSIAVALANAVEAGTPVQFYLCGLDPETGKHRYRGCRYGIEGSQYMSGFGFF